MGLLTPPAHDYSRAAFWARGWLMVFALAQRELIIENLESKVYSVPIVEHDRNAAVLVYVWLYRSIERGDIEARIEILKRAADEDWPVYISENVDWTVVATLRFCASSAPFFDRPISRRGQLAEVQCVQAPLASKNTTALTLDQSYTRDNNYRVDGLLRYNELYLRPRMADDAKNALQILAIEMYDRVACLDSHAMFVEGRSRGRSTDVGTVKHVRIQR
ncbi:unnamed protein product [Anisakis simplex]|uniref:Uncharacterized protein n=1 Tax=Anisakis simplex TaxID=6269 RepID=A0A0M3J3J1_ANISI|nr:unnamed protein product [Anisakis simplex]